MLLIKLDRLLYYLLCAYAMLVPLELVLEVFGQIDTIFKPYRVVSLLLIGGFGVKLLQADKLSLRSISWADACLYLMFLYGLLVSFYNMVVAEFSLGKFYNEIFQTGLYVAAFFIAKQLALSEQQLRQIARFLLLGVLFNVLYTNELGGLMLHSSRQSGFFDNPNYLSLAAIYGISYLLVFLVEGRLLRRLLLLTLLVPTASTFLLAGSRAGIAVLLLSMLLILAFQTWRMRGVIIGAALLAAAVYAVGLSPQVSVVADSVLVRRLENRSGEEDPRFPIWEGVWRASQETHFVGMGLGQFEARFPEFYRGEYHRVIYEVLNYGYHLSPHSDYFSVLITFGLPGLVLFLVFFLGSARGALFRLLETTEPAGRRLFLLQLACVLMVCVFGLAAENFVSGLYWMLLTIGTYEVKTPS
ncbi:MAG: hypothetical protein D6772_16100 [Bacteroidetes bacterium]|nr:MAG: hypothetical protein D6772_16100 [Bacteroidota bacterium]